MTPEMALADAIRLGEAGYRAGAWADGMTGVSSSAEAATGGSLPYSAGADAGGAGGLSSSSSAFASLIEAFGEPAVDRGEQVADYGALTLIAPQPGEAGRGAQFPRLGRHLPRQRDGVAKVGFGQFLLALPAADLAAHP